MLNIIGFNLKELVTADKDYLSVRVVLQSYDDTQKYDLVKDGLQFSGDIVTAGFSAVTYKRFYIGTLENEEVNFNQNLIRFELNPESSFLKRSFYSQMIRNIEAYLGEPDSIRHRSYMIAGRSIERIPIDELIALRERFLRKEKLELEGVDASSQPKSIRWRMQ